MDGISYGAATAVSVQVLHAAARTIPSFNCAIPRFHPRDHMEFLRGCGFVESAFFGGAMTGEMPACVQLVRQCVVSEICGMRLSGETGAARATHDSPPAVSGRSRRSITSCEIWPDRAHKGLLSFNEHYVHWEYRIAAGAILPKLVQLEPLRPATWKVRNAELRCKEAKY